MQSAGRPQDQWKYDKLAIQNSEFDLPGLATGLGLSLRQVFGLNFNTATQGYTNQQTQQEGDQLMHIVRTDPQYSQLFSKYNVDQSEYPEVTNFH
jgi:hypothetical protein